MINSPLRSLRERRSTQLQSSPFSSRFATQNTRAHRPRIAFDDTRHVHSDVDDDDDDLDSNDRDVEQNEEEDEDEEEDEESEADDGLAPLLPIFEAAHLDGLPVYNLTHAIRLLVVPRCETTLTWDQLRTPQIGQFMIKPIQKNILTSHFSRATLYALMANCLQFSKEAAENPGNRGTSTTRAMVCELLAIRLLKEYTTRELIDALSYDFFPLQGLHATDPGNPSTLIHDRRNPQLTKQQGRVARISTLEVATRAPAKRFLAHPLVVQQLEAIWAGTIVFHSAADNAHRPPLKIATKQLRGYGAINGEPAQAGTMGQRNQSLVTPVVTRRSVTIYNPREASLFKLSRLRVPRYRSFFSTVSLSILLGLFVAVLAERSVSITPLEILFWFWSAGFMLDEVVGFTDQGFNLYLLSIWNSFDIGILFILIIYYCLRIYGLAIADDSKEQMANVAYDVLAVNAILLFPRLFSILDHYPYFSQLLIAFRIMVKDLMAILILISVSCSGFFVAFTLSFGNDHDKARDVAYTLFQIIMGFTPAAWDKWEGYNIVGQATLVVFLIITHFLVVTILITVLTNTFMKIVQNANDEHQFVFAVNTISMVKSDALFSYIAPTNILAWLFTPSRYCLPFRQYVKLNRTIIKITHFPVLFSIYAYERLLLNRSVYEPTDLIEQRGREKFQLGGPKELGIFSPAQRRTRERSIATTHQDKALDEVFRRPLRHSVSGNIRDPTAGDPTRGQKTDTLDAWFSRMGNDEPASPPLEQDRGVVDRLERPRPSRRRITPRHQPFSRRDFSAANMSVASDPEDFINTSFTQATTNLPEDNEWMDASQDDSAAQQAAEDDGDDELVTNDEQDNDTMTSDNRGPRNIEAQDYFQQFAPQQTRFRQPSAPQSDLSQGFASSSGPSTKHPPTRPPTRPPSRAKAKRQAHARTLSTNTILYNPIGSADGGSSTVGRAVTKARESGKSTAKNSSPPSETKDTTSPTNRNKPIKKARPILPDRSNFQSAPNLAGLLALNLQGSGRRTNREHSPYAMDLVSDLGDNKAVAGAGFLGGDLGMPGSLGTRMGFLSRSVGQENEDQQRMGRLILTRMNTLEENFREVLQEVKRRNDGEGSGRATGSAGISTPTTPRRRDGRESRDIREIRDSKALKVLGKKRKEGAWIEDEGARRAQTPDPEGRGSSI